MAAETPENLNPTSIPENQGHTCVTFDGVPIRIGLRVRDYDNKVGTVTGFPHWTDGECDGKGWSGPNARGCWWDVTRDGEEDRRPKGFDGSRMTTRGV